MLETAGIVHKQGATDCDKRLEIEDKEYISCSVTTTKKQRAFMKAAHAQKWPVHK